jgi:S-adenosylmethionine hydrolase
LSNPIIALTTDFGLRDPYVAEMKAVILSICPNATIVDVSHQIEKFNIRMGAYVLASASPFFPDDTIHLAVVDPGVGTRRQPVLLQTKHRYFIGPDNGLLALAAENDGIKRIHRITNEKLMLPRASNTFHGRDIFAPASAHLANGTPPAEFGPAVRKIVTPKFAKIIKRKDLIVGEVIHVDDFGNIITNLTENHLKSMQVKRNVRVELKNTRLRLKLGRTYQDVKPHRPLALIGSHNFLEISVNQGNAAGAFNIRSGDEVALHHS